MKSRTSKQVDVFRFAAGCVAASFLSALIYFIFGQISDLRAAAYSCGLMASFVGSGVAFWFSLRGRERKLAVMSLLSFMALGLWFWITYKIVYGS